MQSFSLIRPESKDLISLAWDLRKRKSFFFLFSSRVLKQPSGYKLCMNITISATHGWTACSHYNLVFPRWQKYRGGKTMHHNEVEVKVKVTLTQTTVRSHSQCVTPQLVFHRGTADVVMRVAAPVVHFLIPACFPGLIMRFCLYELTDFIQKPGGWGRGSWGGSCLWHHRRKIKILLLTSIYYIRVKLVDFIH